MADLKKANTSNRRQFLGSVLGGAGAALLPLAEVLAYPDRVQIETLRDVLNIRHLDQAASRTLSREAYHFIVGAADDGSTKAANRAAFEALSIRPRRLVDVSKLDTGLNLLGTQLDSPILLAPAGNQMLLHSEGELATARAAAKRGHLMIAGQMANFSIDEIAATGVASWFQIYPSASKEFMLHLAEQAREAGCRALVVTIDGPGRGNHEAARWFAAHRDKSQHRPRTRLGNFEGFDGRKGIGDASFTWQDVDWLAERVGLPVVLKGIVTAEDARLCRRHQVAGIIVSNHGGRQQGTGRGTLEVLPEVVDAIKGRMPVLMDGGIRRGSDAFKALALGADAVCIGRPYLWGLGAFGQAGVEKCLRILQSELENTMKFAGTPALSDINPEHVWQG